MSETAGHHFKFSRDWRAGKRLCGECRQTYDEGQHVEVRVLEPYTKYVCPKDSGLGHSSTWTGSYDCPELRTVTDDLCICGETFVKEDAETWQLSWRAQYEPDGLWHRVVVVRSHHAADSQRRGPVALMAQGEAIRSVEMVQLTADPS